MLAGLILFGFADLTAAAIGDNCHDSMIAYWKLDGGDPYDSYGNYHGNWIEGQDHGSLKVAGAAKFNGDNHIVVADTSHVLDLTTGFTIEFWFQRGLMQGDGYLIKKQNSYEIMNKQGTTPSQMIVEVNIGGKTLTSPRLQVADANGRIPYHVAITNNLGGSGNLSLYINGNIVDSVSGAGLLQPLQSDLFFGEGFIGLMDEIAFYNADIGATDIQRHYSDSSGGRNYCYVPGADGGSSSRTDFTIAGCDIPDETILTVPQCQRGGQFDGQYFCGADRQPVPYKTLDDAFGCSFGENEESYNPQEGSCCPPNFKCDVRAGGTNICQRREDLCSDYKDNTSCLNAQCFWKGRTEDEGVCIEYPTSCADYMTEGLCKADTWGMSAGGAGAATCNRYLDVCGVNLTANCACAWNPGATGAGGYCSLAEDYEQEIYKDQNHILAVRCSKQFSSTDCIDGLQNISWTAVFTDKSGASIDLSDFDEDCIRAETCWQGWNERTCGAPVIKVPGFSIYALIAAGLIIVLFYLFRIKRKHQSH